jgi:hypothetical protein
VFVDSGGWFAHLVAEDASHAAARDLFGRALRERWSLVTTNVVVIETYALLINRALDGRRIGLEMLDDMGAGLSTCSGRREAVRFRASGRLQNLSRTGVDSGGLEGTGEECGSDGTRWDSRTMRRKTSGIA